MRNAVHLYDAHLHDALIGESGHVYGSRRSLAHADGFVMTPWSEKAANGWRAYPHLAAFMATMAQAEVIRDVLKRSDTA